MTLILQNLFPADTTRSISQSVSQAVKSTAKKVLIHTYPSTPVSSRNLENATLAKRGSNENHTRNLTLYALVLLATTCFMYAIRSIYSIYYILSSPWMILFSTHDKLSLEPKERTAHLAKHPSVFRGNHTSLLDWPYFPWLLIIIIMKQKSVLNQRIRTPYRHHCNRKSTTIGVCN